MSMNKYIRDIKETGKEQDYPDLIGSLKRKLEDWIMQQHRFSDDLETIEVIEALKYIEEEITTLNK